MMKNFTIKYSPEKKHVGIKENIRGNLLVKKSKTKIP
jgi:hypothetical protein